MLGTMVDSHEQVLGRLHHQFEASNQEGTACVVSGSPGSGKTYLAERFLGNLPTTVPRLRGKGRQTGVTPLLPICEAIRSHEHGGNLDQLRAVAEEYVDAIPLLKDVLGPLLRARARTVDTRSTLREVIPSETFTFVALSRLLASFEGRAPPVLFVDDIQWIDASSTAFLGYFASQIRARRVFLLLTRRANGHVDERTRALLDTLQRDMGGRALELSIGGLSRTEQLHLVHSVVGPVDLSDEDLDWLNASSQGKPYYLREVVRLLLDRGELVREGAAWQLRAHPRVTIVPPSLQQYIRHRIQAVTGPLPDAGEIVQFAACLGTTFDARVLAEALNQPIRKLAGVLELVEQHTGLIHRDGRSTIFNFDHDLTREAVLADLGDLATEVHERLGNVLAARGAAASMVAFQFEAAGNPMSASTWALAAANQSLQDSHFQTALQHSRNADRLLAGLGLPASHERRIETALATGRALFGAERYQDVVTELEARASRSVPILHLLGRAAARLPERESYRDSVAYLHAALAALPEQGEEGLRAEIWTDLVNSHDILGHHAESRAAYRTAIAIAKQASDSRTLVRLMRLSCIFWQPEKVIETIERALVVAKRLHLSHEIALCENNLGSAYWAIADLERARTHFTQSDRRLEALGGYRRDTPLNNLGILHIVTGDFDRARGFLEMALHKSCDPHSALFIQSNLGVLEAISGDLAASEARLRSAVVIADASGDVFFQDCLRHNLANLLLELGQPGEALDVAQGCSLHHSHGDELLVAGKRARLLVRAFEAMGLDVPDELRIQSAVLDRTTKPQAWLYRSPWYITDIEFWED